jgi:hypothetical protein
MPQQRIYTSAPRGLVAGRSGYCTVARSASLREALMLQLEKFCYYQHLSLTGGRERPISTCRLVDIRGTRFQVLSRLQDAGLDFTGRTNFIAHHLVFTPEEIREYPAPPVILRDWPGWAKSWGKEPQLLENENWADLAALTGRATVPAQTWRRVTGDAIHGYGLLEARAGASFRVDDLSETVVLDLLAESLALLEVRDPRRDCRTAAWNCTFTTSLQEQDNPADFRWRCLHADNPAASRFATPEARALADVRAGKCTDEEAAFARTGRSAPRMVTEPPDVRVTEGLPAQFTTQVEGVPAPSCQWYAVDRAGRQTALPGETNPGLVIAHPAPGVARYVLGAINSAGAVQSRVATLSVEEPLKLAPAAPHRGPQAGKSVVHQKSDEEIERQRQRLAAEKARANFRLPRWTIPVVLAGLFAIAAGCALGLYLARTQPPELTSKPGFQTNQDNDIEVVVSARGTQPLTYLWFTNDQLTSSTTIPVCTLPRYLMGHSIVFQVIVTNLNGTATSAPVPWLGLSGPATPPEIKPGTTLKLPDEAKPAAPETGRKS